MPNFATCTRSHLKPCLQQIWEMCRRSTRRMRCAINPATGAHTEQNQYGRPFIILREQAKKTRTHGIEAIKVRLFRCAVQKSNLRQSHILAARTVANIVRTSLGPRGQTRAFAIEMPLKDPRRPGQNSHFPRWRHNRNERRRDYP